VVVAYLKVLAWNISGVTEGNYDRPQNSGPKANVWTGVTECQLFVCATYWGSKRLYL